MRAHTRFEYPLGKPLETKLLKDFLACNIGVTDATENSRLFAVTSTTSCSTLLLAVCV